MSFVASHMNVSLLQQVQESTVRQPHLNKSQQAPDELQKKGIEFANHFLSTLYEMVYEHIETDPITGGGEAEKLFRKMLVREYVTKANETDRLGLAKNINASLLRLQEVK